MFGIVRRASASVLLAALWAAPTYGAVIDFTDDRVGFSGSLGTIEWILTGNPIEPNRNEGGPGAIGILVGDNDGVGVLDDEVTFRGEFLTLSFNQTVKLTAAFFLDLYISPDLTSREVANISVGATPNVSDASVAADDIFQNDFGYRELLGISLVGSEFTFWAAPGNDAQGAPDYALAAVKISPIPIPASLLLLVSALAVMLRIRRDES